MRDAILECAPEGGEPVRSTLRLAAAALLVACSTACARRTTPNDTLWDGVLKTASTEIPFRFEMVTTGSDAKGFFFEGDRKVASTSGTLRDGTYTFDYDYLNTTLSLKPENDELVGAYINR